jgi:hypothetical protein
LRLILAAVILSNPGGVTPSNAKNNPRKKTTVILTF